MRADRWEQRRDESCLPSSRPQPVQPPPPLLSPTGASSSPPSPPRFQCREKLGVTQGEGAAWLTAVPLDALVYGSGDSAVLISKVCVGVWVCRGQVVSEGQRCPALQGVMRGERGQVASEGQRCPALKGVMRGEGGSGSPTGALCFPTQDNLPP